MASAYPSVQEEPLQPGTRKFRSQLADVVRSIGWSYAIFWSISTSQSGVLSWNDGFYNGEIKTRKITNNLTDLTPDQLVLQRSEQLRELYNALLSGECDRHARRPVAALSPEDLGNTEWYYMVCMTYAFQHGHGLPGKSYASNGFVWLCNVQTADSKTFPRALLAKNASIQTIVCFPFMSGVLELGTTQRVSEDPTDLVNRITDAASFWELRFPAYSEPEEPISSPSPNYGDTPADADIVMGDLIHNAIEDDLAMFTGEHDQLGDDVVVAEHGGAGCSLEQIPIEIDELYSLCCEDDDNSGSWLVDDDPAWPCHQLVPAAAVAAANDVGDIDDVASRTSSCFVAWKGADSDEQVAAPFAGGGESQKLLKKAVDGGAWMMGRGSAAVTQEGIVKNHVISERRRREKLNEMILTLKSLVPSIHKMDKISILAETIAYVKELEKRVEELESSGKPSRDKRQTDTRSGRRRREIIAGKKVSGAKRKPSPESDEVCGGGGGGGGVERERRRQWVISQDDAPMSNVNVAVTDKEVLLEVQCQWKDLLMTRVFDAIKSLNLDVLSVQASAPNGLLELKIRAKLVGSMAPRMISEALRKAITS